MKRLLWIIREHDRGYGLRKVTRRVNTYAFRSKQIKVLDSWLLAQELAEAITPQLILWTKAEEHLVPYWYGYVEVPEAVGDNK